MADTLIWDPKAGVLEGAVASRWIRVSTLHTGGTSQMGRWDHQYEFRPGKWAVPSGGTKDYVLTQVQHAGTLPGGRRRRITIAENARFEVFDYPGEYAQRFAGDAKPAARGDPDQPLVLGTVPNAGAGGSRHPGGMNIVLADGSVRGVGTGLFFDPTFQGGIYVATAGLLIHPWPPRPWAGPEIVVLSGWRELVEAARQTRQTSIVVEM